MIYEVKDTMRIFHIIVFYQSDEALNKYVSQFGLLPEGGNSSHNLRFGRFYDYGGFQIVCVKDLSLNASGLRANFVAVQKELTNSENWDAYKNEYIIPILYSPIPIQIF